MAGFSGATGVPLKQMQDAIAQSTANKITYAPFIITTATSFTIPNHARLIMAITDSSSDRCGLFFVVSTAAGSVHTTAIRAFADGTTVTASTNSLTITPSSGSRAITFINMVSSGSLPLVVS